jgi:hypothetical protein
MNALLAGWAALIGFAQVELKPYRYWEGLEVGSWAVVRGTVSSPKGERTSVVRYELTGDGVEAKVVEGIDMRALPEQATTVKWLDALPLSPLTKTTLPRKTMTFAGTEIECERIKYSVEREGKPYVEIDVWRSDSIDTPSYLVPAPGTNTAVPANVAKWRIIAHPKETHGHEMRLVLKDKGVVELGKRRIECLKAEGTFEGVWPPFGKRTMNFTLWLTDEVPGGVLRREVSGEDDGGKQSQRVEITDFHAPKVAAKKKDR